MSYNIITTMSIKILNNDDITRKLKEYLNNINKIYSYIIYTMIKDDEIAAWLIKLNISEEECFNTLEIEKVINDIINIINENINCKKHIIGYKQPSLEIMLKAFEPFIKKLVTKQIKKWPVIEYDDAYQICLMSILKLYNKNYYLHKSLIIKSYNNDILISLRKDRNKPNIISIDDKIIYNDKSVKIVDIIEDVNYKEEIENSEYIEYIQKVFTDMKDILIDYMGERQFEQLFKEYSEKRTTIWSRHKLSMVKNYLNKIGINKSSFDKYL